MEILVSINRWHRRIFGRLKREVRVRLNYIRVVIDSLFYNQFIDIYYAADTCMEPLFWIVDHFAKALGPIFVATITIVGSAIVAIAYIIGIPYWWNRNAYVLMIAIVIGHWLLINIVFHYWMALRTDPGTPPEGLLLSQVVTICKKCIAPKPPRTHHCSVCNRCILKMDHHCPWLNNCIGHFTHRYFFLFCSYILLGILYLMIFGYSIAYDEYFGNLHEDTTINTKAPDAATVLESRNGTATAHRYCITFTVLVCIGVFFALGALTAWHAQLITRGETSIEAHINKKERERLAKDSIIYRNPYDFGPQQNWKQFLGLTHDRSWKRVLLPSRHLPEGNGLTWGTE
ncbi:palmitoyltransferase ZDHHC16-like [Ornithodoros turicata]|uniref:palmitoyltransferase ZDHHC16-like n=1 Tax=Ornithodoros turicata TaxID=34597 RepID=UPI00313A4C48